MVSIIIPMYNSARTIEDCVHSILNQTYQDLELLLINDCSKDETFTIARKLADKDKRIHVFNNERNMGAGLTRNQGLRHATGEWITFCDADDIPDNRWIEDFVSGITQDSDLIIQGFYSDNWPDNDTGYIIAYDSCGDRDTVVEALCKHNVFGYLWCKMYRTSIIREHDLQFKSIVIFEDEMFNLQYMKFVQKISCVPRCNYHYERPDFYAKYGHIDNFKANLDMFATACDSFGDNPMRVKDMFVERTSDWLINAYRRKQPDRRKKLRAFCNTIVPYLPKAKNCRRSVRLLHYFLLTKSIFLNNIGMLIYISIPFLKR